jgi:hypothetical protein
LSRVTQNQIRKGALRENQSIPQENPTMLAIRIAKPAVLVDIFDLSEFTKRGGGENVKRSGLEKEVRHRTLKSTDN